MTPARAAFRAEMPCMNVSRMRRVMAVSVRLASLRVTSHTTAASTAAAMTANRVMLPHLGQHLRHAWLNCS
jgi:hypothetical protein